MSQTLRKPWFKMPLFLKYFSETSTFNKFARVIIRSKDGAVNACLIEKAAKLNVIDFKLLKQCTTSAPTMSKLEFFAQFKNIARIELKPRGHYHIIHPGDSYDKEGIVVIDDNPADVNDFSTLGLLTRNTEIQEPFSVIYDEREYQRLLNMYFPADSPFEQQSAFTRGWKRYIKKEGVALSRSPESKPARNSVRDLHKRLHKMGVRTSIVDNYDDPSDHLRFMNNVETLEHHYKKTKLSQYLVTNNPFGRVIFRTSDSNLNKCLIFKASVNLKLVVGDALSQCKSNPMFDLPPTKIGFYSYISHNVSVVVIALNSNGHYKLQYIFYADVNLAVGLVLIDDNPYDTLDSRSIGILTNNKVRHDLLEVLLPYQDVQIMLEEYKLSVDELKPVNSARDGKLLYMHGDIGERKQQPMKEKLYKMLKQLKPSNISRAWDQRVNKVRRSLSRTPGKTPKKKSGPKQTPSPKQYDTRTEKKVDDLD